MLPAIAKFVENKRVVVEILFPLIFNMEFHEILLCTQKE